MLGCSFSLLVRDFENYKYERLDETDEVCYYDRQIFVQDSINEPQQCAAGQKDDISKTDVSCQFCLQGFGDLGEKRTHCESSRDQTDNSNVIH